MRIRGETLDARGGGSLSGEAGEVKPRTKVGVSKHLQRKQGR